MYPIITKAKIVPIHYQKQYVFNIYKIVMAYENNIMFNVVLV